MISQSLLNLAYSGSLVYFQKVDCRAQHTSTRGDTKHADALVATLALAATTVRVVTATVEPSRACDDDLLPCGLGLTRHALLPDKRIEITNMMRTE